MNATRLSGRASIVIGGILIGCGAALFLASLSWPPLQTISTIFYRLAPLWVWGLITLLLGVILLRFKMPPSPPLQTSGSAIGGSGPTLDGSNSEHLENSDDQAQLDVQQPAPAITAQAASTPNLVVTSTEAHGSSTHKVSSSGPRIVAIGGGTGMPQLLRGLRTYTDNITAIVTVADDGGSSGRLRGMGMLPPGDFRNNIAALSDSEDLLTRLFQYRFARSQPTTTDSDESGLAGHNFGNLFIATMTAVTGSFEAGLMESSRVLAVRGRVLPSTLEQITLCAELRRNKPLHAESPDVDSDEEWVLVEGESKIPEVDGSIQRVFLKPQSPRAYPEAIRAILQADLILAGPGSFFTSVMPNLLVPAVRDAILASKAPSVYLCNIATQPGETDNFTVSTHMHYLRLHTGDAITNVLANNQYDPHTQPARKSQWVTLPRDDRMPGYISDMVDGHAVDYRLFTGDLVKEDRPAMHDSRKLAACVMNVYNQLKTESISTQQHN